VISRSPGPLPLPVPASPPAALAELARALARQAAREAFSGTQEGGRPAAAGAPEEREESHT
jgi:hypothetical protein